MSKEKFTVDTKVFRNGSSQSLALRKAIMEEANVQIGEVLECYVEEGKIIYQKKSKSKKDKIIEAYQNGEIYGEKEVEWGKTVGREEW